MKTKRTLRSIGIICLTLALLCVVCSATGVQNRFYNLDSQSTAVTSTYGYSEGNFSGNYYGDGHTNNNAIVYGSCRGGPRNSFYTYMFLEMRYVGAPNFIKHWGANSVIDGDNELENSISKNLNDWNDPDFFGQYIDPSSTDVRLIGTVSEYTYGISNTNDRWDAYYYCYWVGQQAGWSES